MDTKTIYHFQYFKGELHNTFALKPENEIAVSYDSESKKWCACSYTIAEVLYRSCMALITGEEISNNYSSREATLEEVQKQHKGIKSPDKLFDNILAEKSSHSDKTVERVLL